METERRNHLKIVDRNPGSSWEERMRSEMSRVHALIDMVNCQADGMVCGDALHAIKVLEKNAELRELQAYYKGLRFAIDRRKDSARSSRGC